MATAERYAVSLAQPYYIPYYVGLHPRRLGGEPGLQQVVDKRPQIVAQDQQDREQDDGKEDNEQRIFDKALPGSVGGKTRHLGLLFLMQGGGA